MQHFHSIDIGFGADTRDARLLFVVRLDLFEARELLFEPAYLVFLGLDLRQLVVEVGSDDGVLLPHLVEVKNEGGVVHHFFPDVVFLAVEALLTVSKYLLDAFLKMADLAVHFLGALR